MIILKIWAITSGAIIALMSLFYSASFYYRRQREKRVKAIIAKAAKSAAANLVATKSELQPFRIEILFRDAKAEQEYSTFFRSLLDRMDLEARSNIVTGSNISEPFNKISKN